MKTDVTVVIPNWNGAKMIGATIKSLQSQSLEPLVIVVDNKSSDNSVEFIKREFPDVILLEQSKNLGFAGGVNVGFDYAIEHGAKYVASFNNDAVAAKDWLKNLVATLESNNILGIATSKILDSQNKHIDSTGEFYTIWGLPYPRGRGEPASDKYDKQTVIFGASGGASLYRVKMLKQVGLFDEKFFMYYEDIDLSFRAQVAGWQVAYQPKAEVYHQIGASSAKVKGLVTYHTFKNLPMVGRKNLPSRLLPKVLPRFWLAYTLFYLNAIARGEFWPATKGWLMSLVYLPSNIGQRYKIQTNGKVTGTYINQILVHDLPPTADRLRSLRSKWRRLTGRRDNG